MKTTIKKLAWQWRGLIAVPFSMLIVYILRSSGSLEGLELAFFDQYMRHRPPIPQDQNIVIVGIDEADVQALGTYPFADRLYVELLQKLIAMEPRAIGLDIYRDVPVEPGHAELVALFQAWDQIIGIEKVIGEESWQRVAPPPILKAKGQVGANDLLVDPDGKVRRVLISLPLQSPEEGKIPSLGAYLAALYLEEQGIDVNQDLWLNLFPSLREKDGGYTASGDLIGYQIILNYRGPRDHFERVSLRDVLDDRLGKDWGRDRLILIGNVSESFTDLFYTPYTTAPNNRMSGVEIHAHLASQIINTVTADYPVIKTWSELTEWLWIGGWSLVGGMIAWQRRYLLFSSLNGIWLAVPGIFVILITYLAFLQGYWLPLVPPLLALGFSELIIICYMAYKASEIRQTFGRYIHPQIVANLIEDPNLLKIGGEKQQITILVCDLRGFTAISESREPQQVVEVINYFFKQMAEVIAEYEGIIDEFLGDGILVLFGVPLVQKDDAVRAIACSLAMQKKLKLVNQMIYNKYPDFPPLKMGVGINTGEVIVGNIGSENHTKYGVVGNTINLAYRIESCTVGGQILVSEATLQEANQDQTSLEINQSLLKHFKGAQQPQTIYEIKGIKGQYNLSLDYPTEEFFLLPEPLELEYSLLDGKMISPSKVSGELRAISANRGKIFCAIENPQDLPEPLANITYKFLNSEFSETEEYIYSKVIKQNITLQEIEVDFTSIPTQIKFKLDKLYQELH